MDEQPGVNWVADGAGLITGIALLLLIFHWIPVTDRLPPPFKVATGLVLTLTNMMLWARAARRARSRPGDSAQSEATPGSWAAAFCILAMIVLVFIGGGYLLGAEKLSETFAVFIREGIKNKGFRSQVDWYVLALGLLCTIVPALVRMALLPRDLGRER